MTPSDKEEHDRLYEKYKYQMHARPLDGMLVKISLRTYDTNADENQPDEARLWLMRKVEAAG